MKGFLDFIRGQGVVGLAVGFILGGAVSKVVASLVADIVNPLLSVILGQAQAFKEASLRIGSIQISWGNFVAVFVDFLVIALVVYLLVKVLKLDRLDKKKEKK
ncbi:MAG: large conductance mechanosensitive channel protein MscL [Candidatus Portnoybacteria bacterium CG10_big_fil_rev_8_21_14_0_10_44_7]|uniref:Large conductance mechanosensitive channel protein MscL n=1 Tax=Candidatus Portnoybacteria bacterium CG10_big_fil_rev_8_21_14_0_10_44_7 TaxID=1974816 RepID=A0A2M8KJ31_9BACT|nr:MAG: large conductance mechanosensitive channel protein MscL [Candidatus Portnoybacteria bacterium CG10_big_fil_rev_8_21_14_0_10_44_7]